MICQDIKLLSIHVKDFRCLEDLFIDFQATRNYTNELTKEEEQGGGATVVVAKNGEGKTSLLDAINIGWGTFVSKMPDTRSQGFKKSDIRSIKNTTGQFIETGKPIVDLIFQINGVNYSISRKLTSSEKKAVTTTKDSKILAEFAYQILHICNEQSSKTTLPIIAYYGDNRVFADNVLTKGHIKAMLNRSRKFAYADSTNPKSGYKEFIEWFAHLQTVIADAKLRYEEANKQENKKAKIDAWGDIAQVYYYNEVITSVVKKALEVSGWDNLSFSIIDKTIYALKTNKDDNTVYNRVPIDNLSAGTKAVLGIVADLAYRCCTLNPHLQTMAAMETPGIVLIDEIDLHLHPSWQQKVIPTLQNIFPKIQFIVTTHSPQVISSVPRECVRIINNGMNIPFNIQTEGVESQDILAQIFGTNPAPQHDPFVQMLNQYASMEALDQAETQEACNLRQQLIQHFGEQYPPLQRIEIHRKFFAKRKDAPNA